MDRYTIEDVIVALAVFCGALYRLLDAQCGNHW